MRPRRSLRARLLLATLGSLFVAAFLFVVVLVSSVQTSAGDASLDEFHERATLVGRIVSERWQDQSGERGGFDEGVVRTLARVASPDATAFYDGVPLNPPVSSARQERGLPPAIPAVPESDRDIVDSLEFSGGITGDGFFAYDPTTVGNNEPRQGVFVPIEADGYVLGHLLVTRPVPELSGNAVGIIRAALVAAAIGLLAALALTVYLTGRIVRPLRALQVATRSVADGRPGVKVEATGTQEIDALAADFNLMVHQLAERDALAREFLMKVTHDLRTPLTAIRGHTSALADGVVPEENIPRSLQAVEGEAARLETMVADLLDLARLDAHQFRVDVEEVDPDEILEHAYMALAATAEQKGVSYQHDIGRLQTVQTDPSRVQQIVGNLLSNAIHWTSEGGVVRLEAHSADKSSLVVSVTDTGPGIPEDQWGRIFEPFTSKETPSGRTGSGLGLAISRQLARALGGDVSVESTEGVGSTFTLRLPADARKGPSAAASPAASPAG